jgi:UDP-N-acetylglucosamine diphosphorylase/glucosamine-1-phosphate N-acetyltransferase
MQINDAIIRSDFEIVTANRNSQPIPSMVNTIEANQIFIEEGAKLTFCTLNASTGPIYIGRKAEIMEGSSIRGPFAIGYNSVVKMNSRIYGGTSLGPYCMGGGEIKNAVMMGYSNKAHDGYLGDAVIGEWCNLGAGSSNSNLKNSAGTIKIFSMGLNDYVSVGQKCGVIMGDYSRVAINSSLNTGSMIGVSCNVFGEGLLHNTIPHFSFGVKGKQYDLDTAIKDINNWKGLKEMELSKDEINILQYIFTNNKQL